MTIDELKQYCDGEFQNVERIMTGLYSVYSPDKIDYSLAEQASVAAFIVNIYTGFESILKQMLIYDKLDVQDSPEWHEKVLRKAGEIGILPPELHQIFIKYLTFRNYFVYTYIFNIKWDDLKILADEVKGIRDQFRVEVEEYLQTI